jgi:hypothetical protein
MCLCEFIDGEETVAKTNVVLISKKDDSSQFVQCEIPTLTTRQADTPQAIRINIIAWQETSWLIGFPTYKVRAVNFAVLNLVPLPVLSMVDPSVAFNPVSMSKLLINGINFFNSPSLVCVFDSVLSPATYVSQT